MKSKTYALSFCLLIATASLCIADDKNNPLPIEQAIHIVGEPAGGFANMSPFELQTHYRLMWLLNRADYKYEAGHAEAWLRNMRDKKQNMYARLCSAYFLLDQHEEARSFVESQLQSKNLRYRYNAAEILEMYVGRDPQKEWGTKLLIKLLANGSIDGSGVTSSPAGNYPQGDRDDIMMTPIDGICWSLGFMKEKKAVPALISVLERRPRTGGAAFALGEIGDERAIPILMEILKDRSGYEYREVTALGKLKAKEAVPILISRLGNPETTFSGLDNLEMEDILEALLAIGDPSAIPPIKAYIATEPSKSITAVANRILAQLDSSDPVMDLLDLLNKETYEPERSDIISDLVKYQDSRVVEKLAKISRTSESAFMRREAILGLRDIGDRQSLLVLVSLFDLTWPEDLKAEWGWKMIPNFEEYFPETICICLKQCTGQDFGDDGAKWEEWIKKNVEPGHGLYRENAR